MTAEIHTISLNKEQHDFLNENKSFSLSKITQIAVNEIMERHKIVYNDLEVLQRKANKLQTYVQTLTAFIETKGLWEEFLKTADLAGVI